MGPSQTAPALLQTSRQPGAVSRPYTGVQCPMADTASPDPSYIVRMGPLPRGSVVVLRGAGLSQASLDALITELARVSGHDQIVVVDLADPTASLDVVHDPETMATLLGMGLTPPELRLDQHHSTVPPPERAAWLLRNVRQRGDEYGDVANATPDELRDALVLAAAALNAAQAPDVAPPAPDPVAEAADAERPTVGQLMGALEASITDARRARRDETAAG